MRRAGADPVDLHGAAREHVEVRSHAAVVGGVAEAIRRDHRTPVATGVRRLVQRVDGERAAVVGRPLCDASRETARPHPVQMHEIGLEGRERVLVVHDFDGEALAAQRLGERRGLVGIGIRDDAGVRAHDDRHFPGRSAGGRSDLDVRLRPPIRLPDGRHGEGCRGRPIGRVE